MRMSGQKGFEGWYFKHQKGDDMVAFIPGRAVSGDFIQLISREGARQFQVSDLTVGKRKSDIFPSKRPCRL